MSKYKKSFCYLMIFFLVLSFASCAKEQTPDYLRQITESRERLVIENPLAAFFEITWLAGIDDDKYVDGGIDERMLEERYNVDFKVWKISNYDPEGLSAMIASGDIPDIGYLPYAPYDAPRLLREGFTRTVPLDLYQDYFPYYYEQMEKNAPYSFMYNNVLDEEGNLTEHYYGISFITWNYKWYYNVPLMRLDWLEKVGYSIPSELLIPITLTDDKLGQFSGRLFQTNHIFSHEEMNDILRAFTIMDPDGNGKDDTYGAVLFRHDFRSHWVDLYWGQFGVIASDDNFLYLDHETGDVVPYYAYSGFRDYMEWAVGMKEKGYMRTLPEGYVSDAPQGAWYDQLLETWATGKVGFFTADMQYLCRPDFPEYSDRQPPQSIWLKTYEKNATFVAFPVLAGPGEPGTWGTRRYNMDAFSEGQFRTFVVGASVSDEKLARVFTMWNDRYTNPEDDFWRKVLYGIEGIHYRWTGEPWKSGMIRTPKEDIPENYRMYGSFGGSFSSDVSPVLNEAMAQFYRFFIEDKWASKYTIEPYKYISVRTMGYDMYEDYMNKRNEVIGEIYAVVNDYINRSWEGLLGSSSEEWEQYLERLYDAGLNVLVNKYYNNPEFELYVRPDLD
ncbi:MAG: hypothetical protein GX082_04960 [Clostridiaceae bacterium]|nr:hypothetical protein [Clostridiaceae bacterium]